MIVSPPLQALRQTLEPQAEPAAPATPAAILDVAAAPADAPADADAPSGVDAAGGDGADADEDDADEDGTDGGPSAVAVAAIVLGTLLLFFVLLALCLYVQLPQAREGAGKWRVAGELGAAGRQCSVDKTSPLSRSQAALTLPWDRPRAVVRHLTCMPDFRLTVRVCRHAA